MRARRSYNAQTMRDAERIGVIFDMDGVLVDSASAHRRSWQLLAEQTHLTITDQQFAETFGQPSRQIIRQLWGADLPDSDVKRLDERKESIYRDLICGRVPVMPGAVALLRRLQDDRTILAIGSSGPPANIELMLSEMGVSELFSVVVTGVDVEQGKPAPDVFLIAARRMRLDCPRCVVVEDAPVGIEAAHRAGMVAVGLVGTHDRAALGQAELVVDSLGELSLTRMADLLRRRRP